MRREDVIFGLLLLAVPVTAGGRRGLRTVNDALQVAIAKRRAPRYSVGIDLADPESALTVVTQPDTSTIYDHTKETTP